jgi:hypothetical protein
MAFFFAGIKLKQIVYIYETSENSTILKMNIGTKCSVALLFFGLLGLFHAQGQETTPMNEFVKSYDSLLLKVSINNTTEVFEVQSDNLSYSLVPNTSYKLKMHFNFRFLSFALGFSSGFIPGNNDDDRKGESRTFLMQTNLLLDHFIQFIEISRVKGF